MDTETAAAPMTSRKPHGKPCGAKTRTCQGCGKHQRDHRDGSAGHEFLAKPCDITRGLGAGGRCKLHGGKTPQGLASANLKTGRWSEHLPAGILGAKFQEAYVDRALMALRQDAALVDAMLTSYTATMRDTGRALTEKQQTRVLALIEQRRKIVESEARRLRDLAQVVPVDQYRTALGLLFRLITDHLGDNLAARREIQATARRLLLGKGPVVEVELVEGGP